MAVTSVHGSEGLFQAGPASKLTMSQGANVTGSTFVANGNLGWKILDTGLCSFLMPQDFMVRCFKLIVLFCSGGLTHLSFAGSAAALVKENERLMRDNAVGRSFREAGLRRSPQKSPTY